MARDDLCYCHHQLRSRHLCLTKSNVNTVNTHRQTAQAVGPSHTIEILFHRNTERHGVGAVTATSQRLVLLLLQSLPPCDRLFQILPFFILQFDTVWSDQL